MAMTRLESRLRTTLQRNASPAALGAIECAIPPQLIISGLNAMEKSGLADAAEMRFIASVTPMIKRAAIAPFAGFSLATANALINASADACVFAKGLAIETGGVIKPLAYFYTIYFWVESVIARGALTVNDDGDFAAAWALISAEMLKHDDLMQHLERAAKKRAARLDDAFRSLKLFPESVKTEAAA